MHLFATEEFAKTSNTTKQTLFHYNEIGLLSPHFKYDVISYFERMILYYLNHLNLHCE